MMNIRKKIDEYLLIRKKAKRLETLEKISEVTQDTNFTASIMKDYVYTNATSEDLVVLQGIADNLSEVMTIEFKSLASEYISQEISKVYNE
jgi:hypothetical protein